MIERNRRGDPPVSSHLQPSIMSLFSRKDTPDLNLLELVPERCWTSMTRDDGIVEVDMPRFHVAWMQKYLVPKGKYPYIRIKLDPFGSHVWNAIDGTTNIGDLSERLRTEYGDAVEPVHDRIAVFFRQLHQRGFVRLRTAAGELVK